MLIISYLDWFGSEEDFKKRGELWKKACAETEGVHSTRLMVPHQAKYHYAWVTEADSYVKMLEANAKVLAKMPRDKSVTPYSETVIFTDV